MITFLKGKTCKSCNNNGKIKEVKRIHAKTPLVHDMIRDEVSLVSQAKRAPNLNFR